jgi:hypothetical protein
MATPQRLPRGEIVPVHPIARSLCNVESIIGQLYPATLLARLVTLEIEGSRRPWCRFAASDVTSPIRLLRAGAGC